MVPVELPALRDRGDDVVRLAAFFAEKFANEIGCAPPLIAPSAIAALRRHAFPGTVRELANVIERAVILSDRESLDAEDLGRDVDDAAYTTPATAGDAAMDFVLPATGVVLEDVERGLVRQALERTSGNKSRAARILGLTRATLRYRIEKLGLWPYRRPSLERPRAALSLNSRSRYGASNDTAVLRRRCHFPAGAASSNQSVA